MVVSHTPGASSTTEYPTAGRFPGLRYECRWSPGNTTTSPGDRVDCSPDTEAALTATLDHAGREGYLTHEFGDAMVVI